MTNSNPPTAKDSVDQGTADESTADTYTHGHHESVLRSHRWRTVANSAAYLEDYLQPGAAVLDVGCGPGTISAEMAELVAPGIVRGIDYSADVVAAAAADHGVADGGRANLEFGTGDVYRLTEADDSFDVVHAHQVLQHLSRPVDALKEMRRVCRPTGIVACRDADYASMAWYPESEPLAEWLELYRQTARHNEADPDAGRKLHAWADQAGFSSVEITTSSWCFSEPEDTAWWGGLWADRITKSDTASQMVEKGLAEPGQLDAIATAFRQWSEHPHAWFSVLHGEVICRP